MQSRGGVGHAERPEEGMGVPVKTAHAKWLRRQDVWRAKSSRNRAKTTARRGRREYGNEEKPERRRARISRGEGARKVGTKRVMRRAMSREEQGKARALLRGRPIYIYILYRAVAERPLNHDR